jgi:hypothetical protein
MLSVFCCICLRAALYNLLCPVHISVCACPSCAPRGGLDLRCEWHAPASSHLGRGLCPSVPLSLILAIGLERGGTEGIRALAPGSLPLSPDQFQRAGTAEGEFGQNKPHDPAAGTVRHPNGRNTLSQWSRAQSGDCQQCSDSGQSREGAAKAQFHDPGLGTPGPGAQKRFKFILTSIGTLERSNLVTIRKNPCLPNPAC